MTESLGSGTYEVLRNRLRDAAEDLRGRFTKLNAARSNVFGNIETVLKGTAHVATDHNCVPRDLLAIGDQLLLGYNVQFGLKTDIHSRDVFSLYRLEEEIAHTCSLDTVLNESFEKDFQELYKYYKNTSFSRFFIAGPFVYFVFQVGKSPTDIKAFKWAVEGDSLRYVDNRSDHEVRFPQQHGFRWQRATREQHRSGTHPHVSIDDLVFVECVGGDLTIKIDDNTEDGVGIYSEPVDDADQTLDDAEIYYSVLGNLVLLKMRPYREKDDRYFVYSLKRQSVVRMDAIADSCVLLPDDQGIIFPQGFFLQTGSYKLFDHGIENLAFEKNLSAPNGEDYLYLFTDLRTGTYLHLRYNLIRQEVDTPLICHGQALFDDGRMICFRSQEHPQKHHALQLWQTPMVAADYPAKVETDSILYKIGNRELVRGMAECQELLQLIEKDDSYADLYLDLAKRATDILDGYFWLDREETMQLADPIAKIRDAANAAVDEYEKVVRVRHETDSAVADAMQANKRLLAEIGRSRFDSVNAFVAQLAQLRSQRGEALGLRERKYVAQETVTQLEEELTEATNRLGHRMVQHLLDPDSLGPYEDRIAQAEEQATEIGSVADGKELQESLAQITGDLELLVETVAQLKIEDLTQRTAITDKTGTLLAELNRARSSVKARLRDLLSGEMEADFASQTKLLDQAVAGALETADTPERVDDALTRIMLQLEELEGRFAEFDELLVRLTEKRELLYEAFETRRQHLVEARSRRAEGLVAAAERIMQGIASRALRQEDASELRSYFVSDPMVDKVRQIASQLEELGDTVRMEDVLSRLKTIADDSVRQLRDRQELYTGGEGQIALGKHHFSVNTQPVELTTVVRDGLIQLHVTGTQFFEPLDDPALQASKEVWTQTLPSESDELYRSEFLAAQLYQRVRSGNDEFPADPDEQVQWVRERMQARHDEGYARGVHDGDTAKLLSTILAMDAKLGLLRFSPEVRGVALYVWRHLVPTSQRNKTEKWISSYQTIQSLFPQAVASGAYFQHLEGLLRDYGEGVLIPASANEDTSASSDKESASTDTEATSPTQQQASSGGGDQGDGRWVSRAARYLFEQLRVGSQQFVASPRAIHLQKQLDEHLPPDQRKQLHHAVQQTTTSPVAAWTLALDAVDGYLNGLGRREDSELDAPQRYRFEIANLLASPDTQPQLGSDTPVAALVESLAGDHPRIQGGKMPLDYYEFLERTEKYQQERLPRFRQLQATKHRLLQEAQKRLRVDEFKPQVLTSFVRNKLIDEVYLPLIGDNLAKQMGASGANKRTDRMGLLLLISPPGYGKTTLMEYIASRLGLVFVKVNGPALGHQITSLDPAEATNASAREEVQRINVALEMGDNVMLYLDDIQHCNPELLQKFIPLCDATRKIEGVWNGQPKTYDLRGRKVVVVMAGNPYTESGERFQIPDMLSNRADVYNLGEIIGDSADAFELSYIENCLTSNATLQSLARCSSKDQRAVIRAAQLGTVEGLELESNVAADQLADMISVLSKLLKVRDVILRVNRTYIRSAAQVDAYRTEPPFKLQGSYRNMNRIAEKVVPVMNDEELESVVFAAYEQDAQTLTRDGESNLLKFKELMDRLTKEEQERWESIKYAYSESVRMQGVEGDDAAAQIMRSLVGLRDGLESIRKVIAQAVVSDQSTQRQEAFESGMQRLNSTLSGLGSLISESVSSGALRIEQANAERRAAESASLPEQKVIVQHSVPRVMTDLVQTQFQLLYDGLRPVLESSTNSGQQLEQLRRSIDNCLLQYQALRAEIESSKGGPLAEDDGSEA